jgi:hypothetical protein
MPRTCWQGRPCHSELRIGHLPSARKDGKEASRTQSFTECTRSFTAQSLAATQRGHLQSSYCARFPPLRRRLFDMSASIGRQHRKARIQTQIPEDARKTRRWRRARGSACCPMSATHAGRSNAWPTVCQPHRTICVLCVHLLTSALSPFLCRGVTGLATRAETIAASRSIIGRGVDLRRQ